MKIIKIISFTLLVLIILAAAGIAIFIKTFDINKYKPEITRRISEQTGRKVELGTIGLDFSLTKGVSVDIADITAAEDPAFGTEPFLTVEQARLNVSVLAYLESKEVLVTQVSLVRPRVNLIKNEAGVFNFTSMIEKAQPAPSGPGSAPAQGSAPAPAAGTSAPATAPDVKVENVVVEGARVRYVDNSQSPALDLTADRIDLLVKDFAFNKPFSFDVKAAVFSDRQNIAFNGRASFDSGTSEVKLERSNLTLDISATNLGAVPKAWIPPGVLDGGQNLQGEAEVAIAELLAGPAGLTAATADVKARVPSFQLASPALRFENINLDLRLNGQDVDIRDVSANFASGRAAVSGEVKDFAGAQHYRLDIQSEGILIGDILRQMKQEAPLAGMVGTRFRVSGSGFADLQSALEGKGNVVVSDGRLEEINILRLVLSRISLLPDLVSRIEMSLPPKYQEYLQKRDTEFEQIDLAVSVGNQKITIPDIELISEVFTMTARTELDFNQNIKFAGTVFIPADLSAAIVAEVKELEGLLQNDGQIKIPLSPYEGPAASMKVMPDMEYLTKYLLLNRGKQEVFKLLDKAIGREEPQPSTEEAPTEQTPQKKQRRPEEELIEGVFDAIFR